MKIDSIVVLCWAGDFRLARICLASIRYFYPDLPLYLMKDITRGDFDTAEVERRLNVSTRGLSGAYGKFFGKIELLFKPELGRFLFIDADQIMTGSVVDALERVDAEFIVEPDRLPPESPVTDRIYYRRDRLRAWDPAFVLPDYQFNSGQWVAPAGVLSRADFATVAEWTPTLRIRDPETFCMTDQSLLNYVWFRLAQAGRITLRPAEFMILARTAAARATPLAEIAARRAPPRLFHWAGEHKTFLGLMKRSDLLRFFERWYYEGLPGGSRLRLARSLRAAPGNAATWAYYKAGLVKRRLRGKRT